MIPLDFPDLPDPWLPQRKFSLTAKEKQAKLEDLGSREEDHAVLG